MQTVNFINDLRSLVTSYKQAGKKVAFVPTMGNLHEGHLSLVDEARKHADIVIASIFVNPMQFGENEDLDAYPRTLLADSESLAARGCDILFAPTAKEVYPNGLNEETRVDVPSLGNYHCGASRPGHFVGVATVVSKLFNMVQADVAVFGEKDFQQLRIIEKMTKDLNYDINIVPCKIIRESNGLAMSSRNKYLSLDEKKKSKIIFKTLQLGVNSINNNTKRLKDMYNQLNNHLKSEPTIVIDYLKIVNFHSLIEFSEISLTNSISTPWKMSSLMPSVINAITSPLISC